MFLLSENVRLEDTNNISLWQARIWLFIPYKLTISPSHDVLKECVNGEHWDVINFQATFSHFGDQTAK